MTLTRKKRIFYTLIVFVLVFIIYTGRIGVIQYQAARKTITANGKTMNELAVRQREQGVELDSGRGRIIDRNGYPFTGYTKWRTVLYPVSKLPGEDVLNELAGQLGTKKDALISIWSNIRSPYVWKGDQSKANQTSSPEFAQFPFTDRYEEGVNGHQWLGYMSQRPDFIRQLRTESRQNSSIPLSMPVGAAGLEKTFDAYLRGIGGTNVYHMVDGRQRPLEGMGTRVKGGNDKYYPLSIRTTIDAQIQSKLEELTERQGLKEGAIVVLDAKQGDIVAMVSRPFYDPNHINLENGSWSNRAVKAAKPGSIFKIVVAAAAIEEQVTNRKETFHCTGNYGKYGLSCWKKEGHGHITLSEGLAQSCNIVFATLGERLSANSMNQMAVKLGLAQRNGWSSELFLGSKALAQLDQEEAGRVFSNMSVVDGGVLAQTAIGQRDVLMSPLQAANMMVTLLNDGQRYQPRLVSHIHYKDGSIAAYMPMQKASTTEKIHASTSRMLLSWMQGTVQHGTAKVLKSAKWPLAGKSGTAQVIHNGNDLNNQWFTGYGPVGHPKYAVAVLAENRPVNSNHQAMLLFRDTMNMLASS